MPYKPSFIFHAEYRMSRFPAFLVHRVACFSDLSVCLSAFLSVCLFVGSMSDHFLLRCFCPAIASVPDLHFSLCVCIFVCLLLPYHTSYSVWVFDFYFYPRPLLLSFCLFFASIPDMRVSEYLTFCPSFAFVPVLYHCLCIYFCPKNVNLVLEHLFGYMT